MMNMKSILFFLTTALATVVNSFVIHPACPSSSSSSTLLKNTRRTKTTFFMLPFASPTTMQRIHNDKAKKPTLIYQASAAESEDDNNNDNIKFEDLDASDGDALQKYFLNVCDSDGLMDQVTLSQTSVFSDLLSEGDLLESELNDVWKKAPKFPTSENKIDVDSFIQIFRDVDDLFEDDEDDDETETETEEEKSTDTKNNNTLKDTDNDDSPVEEELKEAFEILSAMSSTPNTKPGFLSKQDVLEWDEIESLLNDNLISMEEFDVLWERACSDNDEENNMVDFNAFVKLNQALDDLFEEEDNESATDEDDDDIQTVSFDTSVNQEDLTLDQVFDLLDTDRDSLLKYSDITSNWNYLTDLLKDELVYEEELKEMYGPTTSLINKEQFITLYNTIEDIFEDEQDSQAQSLPDGTQIKQELLKMINKFSSSDFDDDDDDESLPCGLTITEKQQETLLTKIEELEKSSTNMLKSGNEIGIQTIENELSGEWSLLYTSSQMMRFHKGLSGLGGSFPNGKFAGLKQTLTSSKYVRDLEYRERIDTLGGSDQTSFDVSIDGDWELKQSISLLTGEPSIIMAVEPFQVSYLTTSTKADHWKSVRSMNLLDLSYLDENGLRIMRGNTSTDTIFIFQKQN